MPSLSGVLRRGSGSAAFGSSSSLSAAEELANLEDANRGVSYIMEDDMETALKQLRHGNSAFHKLGIGVVWFLRATLGFEQDVIREASERLADAEAMAYEGQRRAPYESNIFRSEIYPPGTEYTLCNAEAQIMSAAVGLLTESLTEAIKGFYKVRKAIGTLDAVANAEKRYLKDIGQSSSETASDFSSDMNGIDHSDSELNSINTSGNVSDDDDFDMFVDADETINGSNIPPTYLGHLETKGIVHDTSDLSSHPQFDSKRSSISSSRISSQLSKQSATPATPASTVDDAEFEASLTRNPIDTFIHSTHALIHGMLLLMLSFVPPSWSKILSIIGFGGDRDRGLSYLWRATRFGDVQGGMGGLLLLGYYNMVLASVDITPKDLRPIERCRELLKEMRSRFPKSGLWLIEESRMLAWDKQLDEGVEVLKNAAPSPMKQIEALRWWELGLQSAYLHQYQQSADALLKCVDLNNWSHGLYYYIAAVSHVEAYRAHKNPQDGSSPDEEKANRHADIAEELLNKVPQNTGRKFLFSRPPPFDMFVKRKYAKWTARAKEWGVRLVDAIGVNPGEEIIFFWGGHRRMDDDQLAESLRRLSWNDGGAGDDPAVRRHLGLSEPTENAEQHERRHLDYPDERAILGLLRGTIYRNLGFTASAREMLESEVTDAYQWEELKGGERDAWTIPVAHYETAVCAWVEAGDGATVEQHQQVEAGSGASRTQKLRECSSLLERVARWEHYDLDTRFGIKVRAGRETLHALGVR